MKKISRLGVTILKPL